MTDFARKLDAAKRSSTAHLLFKCARVLNERAIASLPMSGGKRPRAAHLALFPHIELGKGTRVTELASKLGITKQAVGQLVDDLEGFGMVERTPDPDDGRAKRVCFTEHGESAMLDGLRHLKQVERELSRALGKETVAALHGALTKLHDHLDST